MAACCQIATWLSRRTVWRTIPSATHLGQAWSPLRDARRPGKVAIEPAPAPVRPLISPSTHELRFPPAKLHRRPLRRLDVRRNVRRHQSRDGRSDLPRRAGGRRRSRAGGGRGAGGIRRLVGDDRRRARAHPASRRCTTPARAQPRDRADRSARHRQADPGGGGGRRSLRRRLHRVLRGTRRVAARRALPA